MLDREQILNLLISPDDQIRDVLERFNLSVLISSGQGFGIVVDDNYEILGTVTDGDLRRALSGDFSITDEVHVIMNRAYQSVGEDSSAHEILRKFDSGLKNIPVVVKVFLIKIILKGCLVAVLMMH